MLILISFYKQLYSFSSNSFEFTTLDRAKNILFLYIYMHYDTVFSETHLASKY